MSTTATWEFGSDLGRPFSLTGEVVDLLEEKLRALPDRPVSTVSAVLAECVWSQSRKGHIVVRRPGTAARSVDSVDAVLMAQRALQFVVARCIGEIVYGRWRELKDLLLLMTEVPASGAHRGNGSVRHVSS